MLNRITTLMQRDGFSSLGIMGLRGGMLASKFVLALFIARFIGLEALGIYGLIASAAAIGQIVIRLGVFSSLSREAVGQPLAELTHNLHHYISGCIIIYMLLTPLALFIGWHYGILPLMILTVLLVLFEHVVQDVFILANNLHRPVLANGLLALQSAVWIYLFVALAFFFPALRTLEMALLFWVAGGMVLLPIVLFLTRHWPWKQAFSTPLQQEWYRPYVAKSWRLYVAEIISTATNYLDRYLITAFLSLELVGVYVLFSQVATAIGSLINAGVIRVYTPRLISAYKQGNSPLFNALYRSCVTRSLTGMALMAGFAAIIVPFLIRYTHQPLAMEYLPLLWMLLATLLPRGGADLASTGLYVRHQDKFFLNRILLKLLLAVSMGTTSILLFGIYGTVLTALVVSGVSIFYTAAVWNKTSA